MICLTFLLLGIWSTERLRVDVKVQLSNGSVFKLVSFYFYFILEQFQITKGGLKLAM